MCTAQANVCTAKCSIRRFCNGVNFWLHMQTDERRRPCYANFLCRAFPKRGWLNGCVQGLPPFCLVTLSFR
ncbi:hypothetical protein POVWA2_034050 [Plasmodium ovale wallikeri]|uniref:Uncharacterized protein n=1 Tax=Plasmodium ovale wallikeri TaxID=864142 RepID=A0A1A8Z159_PLAOA|nr:hypothetical protein POVWA1_034890 [Plasmodium ovale wallikeri]SBT37558.1 hypothetical protein POVWA2_034050 [Plasmodium ovale wallikeri]